MQKSRERWLASKKFRWWAGAYCTVRNDGSNPPKADGWMLCHGGHRQRWIDRQFG